MRNKLNFICILISLLPFFVALICYGRMVPFPVTKISGVNGISFSKADFIVLLLIVNILWYILSAIFTRNIVLFFATKREAPMRVVINIIFPVLSMIVLFSNMQ